MKYAGLFLLVVIMISCRSEQNTDNNYTEAIIRQMNLYPKSTLKDIYKFFFQGRFGPGHLIPNKKAALDYLNYELQNSARFDTVMIQGVGEKNQYYRINLKLVKDDIIPKDSLLNAFTRSANEAGKVSLEDWKNEWSKIEKTAKELYPALPGFSADSAEIANNLSQGITIGHHSEAYGKAYFPHYRIISGKEFSKIQSFLSDKK